MKRHKLNVKDFCYHLNPFDQYALLVAKRMGYSDFEYPCLEFVNNCKTPCVQSDGYVDSAIMIIGQNPGVEEDEKDLPFVGPSGRLLMEVLGEFGFKREDFYITNGLKCFLETPKIREGHIKFCASTILRRELNIVKPKKVLLLGEIALKAFLYALGKPKNQQYERGVLYKISDPELDLVDVEFVYTYHPSYILRNDGDHNRHFFLKQFKEHLNILLGDISILVQGSQKTDIKFIKNDSDCYTLLFPKLQQAIQEGKPVVLDLETLSVEPDAKNNQILIIGLGFENGEAYCVFWNWYDKLQRRLVSDISNTVKTQFLLEYLPKLKLIGHNLKFDLMVIYRLYGINLQENIYGDTLVLHHLINEEGPHDLKSLASMYTPYKHYATDVQQTIKQFKNNWYQYIDYNKLAEYCGMDCLATYYLYKLFLQKLEQEWHKISKLNEQRIVEIQKYKALKRWKYQFNVCHPQHNIVKLYDYVMRHYRLIFEMEMNGLPFDLDYIREVREQVTSEVNSLEKTMQEMAGLNQPINWRSSSQVREIFLKLGYKSPIKTPKGEYSYSEEALQKLADEGVELAKLLLQYRGYQKALTTYLSIPEEYREFMRDTDEEHIKRLSCKIKIHGTETGRLSTSDPSFHTIPRDNTYRRMITAERGWVILSADYSMADLRMIAAYSACRSMLQDFESGIDFHTLQAAKIFRKKPEDITKEERSIAKNINFAIAYLSSEYGIARMLNIDVQLAKRYIEEWYADKAEVKLWINGVKSYYDYFKPGDIVEYWNIFGRKRRLRRVSCENPSKLIGEYGHKIREAVNFFPQSTVADLLMIGLLRLDKLLKEKGCKEYVRYLLTIHDALLLEVKEEYVDTVSQLIKEAMEVTVPFFMYPIKVPVEITIGKRWEKN